MRCTIASALLLTLAALGCGKSDSSSSSSSSSSQKTPEEAWKAMREAYLAKDVRALLDTLCAASRKDLIETVGKENVERVAKASPEEIKALAEKLGTTSGELKSLDAEGFVLLILKQVTSDEGERKKLEGTKWKEARVGVNKAVAVTIGPDGKEEKDALVKEGGTWKVDKKETERLQNGGAEELDGPVAGGTTTPPPSTGMTQRTPEEAWRAMVSVIRSRDSRGLWACISRKSQKAMTEGDAAKQIEQLKGLPDEQLEPVLKEWGITARELRRMTNEEIVIASLAAVINDEKMREEALGSTWKGATVNGDTAVATTVKPDGKEEKTALVKEDGTWKVDMEETQKLKD